MPHPTITSIPLNSVGPLVGRAANLGVRNKARLQAFGKPWRVPVARVEELYGPCSAEAIERACGVEPSIPASPDRFGALDVESFLTAYSVSRSTMYREAKAGRLVVRKRGDKCIILVREAEAWASQFPRADYRDQW